MFWDITDTNWGMYMSQSGAGKSFGGGTAPSGNGVSTHAIRIRVNNGTTQGFLIENSNDTYLLSVRGSDGYTTVNGYLQSMVGIITPNISINNGKVLINSSGDLTFWNGGTQLFYVNGTDGNFFSNSNGRVMGFLGVGRTAAARLHIGNNSLYTAVPEPTFYYFDSQGFQSYGGAVNVCAIFDNSIWVRGTMYQNSDERIKKNIQDINDDTALEQILSIQPKTYNYIDETRGTSKVIGFIAQQVREVVPEAVVLDTEKIPDIMSLVDCNSNILTFSSNYDFSSNEKLTFIKRDGSEQVCHITDIISSNEIRIDNEFEGSNVFCYGREIDDFNTLDKWYIFTLNICATQILSRKIDELTSNLNIALDRIAVLESE
jgi:hypothetical protein